MRISAFWDLMHFGMSCILGSIHDNLWWLKGRGVDSSVDHTWLYIYIYILYPLNTAWAWHGSVMDVRPPRLIFADEVPCSSAGSWEEDGTVWFTRLITFWLFKWHTVDGRNPNHQLKTAVFIPLFVGFQVSKLVQDFFRPPCRAIGDVPIRSDDFPWMC